MRYRRSPTRVQLLMVVLMGVAFGALLLWVIPELIGVASPAAEDTYSEWVWDLPLPAVLSIVGLHVVTGALLIGSAWHFIEGWVERRRDEKD